MLWKRGKHREPQRLPGLSALGVHHDGISLVTAQCDDQGRPVIENWAFKPCIHETARTGILKELAEEYDLARRRCSTLLNLEDYRLLLMEAPPVPREEMREAVRWQLKDRIDFDPVATQIDICEFPGSPEGEDENKVFVAVARKGPLLARVGLFEAAGIDVEIVDIPEMAMRNVAALLNEGNRGVAVLALDYDSTILTLSQGVKLYMNREIQFGLNALVDEQDREMCIDRIVLEVRRSLDYFVSHFHQRPIEQLMLGPMPMEIPDIDAYFSERLGLPATLVDIATLVPWRKAIPMSFCGKCFGAFGASLRVVM